MDKRFQFRLSVAAIALALTAVVGSQMGPRVTATTAASAVRPTASAQLGALPASDIIIFVDTARLVNDTLPNFLAGDAELLARVNAKLDRFQKETGVDPRSFDRLAVGLRLNPVSSGDPRFVAIAQGDFVASQLIDTGFATAQKKENIGRVDEQYEGKTISILIPPAGRGDNCSRNGKTEACRMAVAALDSNTIALGDLESVRAAINPGAARVDQGLVDLATRNPNAIAGFAGNLPQGAARHFGIRNGRADKLAASVRQVYGSLSTVGTTAESTLALRTETAEQAREIADGINGLKFITKLGFGGHSGGNKSKAEAFSNMLKALTVNVQNDEVEIKLNVTQTDIAPLIRRH